MIGNFFNNLWPKLDKVVGLEHIPERQTASNNHARINYFMQKFLSEILQPVLGT